MAAQIPAARATCTSTSHHGSSFRHWSRRRPPGRPPGRAGGTRSARHRPARVAGGTDEREEREPETAVIRTWTSIADSMLPSRSTTSGSPACGPLAVTSVPVKTTASVSAAKARLARRSRRGTNVPPGPLVTARLDCDDDRRREHHDREQEVRHHGDRVEVEPHGQQPERCLRDRPERREPRAGAHPPRQTCGSATRPRCRAEQDRKQADDAVAELDERVVVLLGEDRARRAPRPALRTRGPTRSAAPWRR